MSAVKLNPIEIKQNLPFYRWHQRAIFQKSALKSAKKENTSNFFSSLTFGQAGGGLLAGFGIVSFLYGVFFKREEKSFFGKYVWPLIGTAVGAVGISASQPPKDVFNISLVRSGFFDVFGKLKGLVKDNTFFHSIVNLFNEENTTSLVEKTNEVISSSLPLIKDLTPQELESDPDFQGLFCDINELSSFHANIDKLKELFGIYGGQRIFRFFSTNTDIAKQALKQVFASTNQPNGFRVVSDEPYSINEIRESIIALKDCLNEIITPTGLHFDLGYGGLGDEELRIYLASSEVFTHESSKELYRPFISIPLELDLMFEAIKFAHDRFETILQQQESIASLESNFIPGNERLRDQLQALYTRQTKNIDLLIGGTIGLLNSGKNMMLKGVKVGYFNVDANGQNYTPKVVNKSISQQVFEGYIPSNFISVIHEIADGPSNIQLVGEMINSFRTKNKPGFPESKLVEDIVETSIRVGPDELNVITLESGKKIQIPDPKYFCEQLGLSKITPSDDIKINSLKLYLVDLAIRKFIFDSENEIVKQFSDSEKFEAYEKTTSFMKESFPRLWEYYPEERSEDFLENRHTLLFTVLGIDLNTLPATGLSSSQSNKLDNLLSFLGSKTFSISSKLQDTLSIERAKLIIVQEKRAKDKDAASDFLTSLASANGLSREAQARDIVVKGLSKVAREASTAK